MSRPISPEQYEPSWQEPDNGPRDLPPVSTTDPRPGQSVIADWLDENYGEHTQQAYGAFVAAAADLLDDLSRFGFQVVKR